MTIKHVALTLLVLLLSLINPGCRARGPELEFLVQMALDARDQMILDTIIHNTGGEEFTEPEEVYGVMQITDADGVIHVRVEVHGLDDGLAPGKRAWPVGWRGMLPVGGYQLVWGAAGYGATTVDFELFEDDQRMRIDEGKHRRAEFPAVLMSRGYGLSRDLVDLARADLSRRLDIDVAGIQVRRVEKRVFPDTSLGIRRPDESYDEVITPGYVMVLIAQGERYVYHGADDQVKLASPVTYQQAPVWSGN
jgi:hypothetical protein